MPSKRCGKCGETKDVSEFYKRSAGKDGLQNRCKACSNKYRPVYTNTDHDTPERKRCGRCGEVKEASEFSKDRTKKAGLRSQCRDCCRGYLRRYREKNAEALKEYNRQYYWDNLELRAEQRRMWHQNNPDKAAAHAHKRRARKAKVPSDGIAVDYRGCSCYVCGAEAEAIDHVVPLSKGGHDTVDNKRPICHSCNSAKRDHTWPGQPDWPEFLKRRRNQ